VAWRNGQDKLFWDILDSPYRFSIHNSPVGSGKSLAYCTAAIALGKRVAIVTATKGLQDQLNVDFSSIGLFDMRGLQNYTCQALAEGGEFEDIWTKRWGRPTCDIGPCMSGLRCSLKDTGCYYFDDYRKACTSQLVQTNYAYWITINKYGQGLGKFDMVIFDECHAAAQALSSVLSVELTEKEFKEMGSVPPREDSPLQNWRMWSRVQLQKVQGKLEFFAQGAKIGTTGSDGSVMFLYDTDLPDATELRFWKRLEGKFQTLSESSDDWTIETDSVSGTTRIAPIWVKRYAESHLFLSIPRVVLTSATVRPKTAELLGLNHSVCNYTEYPSTFPVKRRPIYWVPTVKLNHRSEQNDLRSWVVRIDHILSRRMDRKGIIHTVSFEKQKYLLAYSRFRNIMYPNTTGNTHDVVAAFRKAEAPAVLVSPSVGTGFDFPFSTARFQIIGKVPFRDARGTIICAQAKEDPDYLNYLTAQDLIQLYGRTNRDPEDFSETFILDDQIEWFLRRYKRFFPQYFLEAFQRVDAVPNPPPLAHFAVGGDC